VRGGERGRDVSHACADAVRRDFSTQVCASSSRSGSFNALSQMLEECTPLLYLQETNLDVCEAILAGELEHGLHLLDGRDLSAKLHKDCMSVERSTNDCATKAG
jgi:hypothetical protein